jgi:RNA polymerase sigma factor for flagellar operon FliA
LESSELILWHQWRTDKDIAARDALILKYSSWTRIVARDVYMRVYLLRDAWQDCAQNALLGLLEAIDRFDPDRGVGFQPYARHRVRGAVFDGIRSLRSSHLHGQGEAEAASATRDRLESLEEGRDGDALDAFIDTTVGLGLGFLLDTQSMPGSALPLDAYAELERDELRSSISAGLQRLPDREKMILTLHYHHHVPFVEIAQQLNITKGRISQLHKRALELLRSQLGPRVEMDC